MRYHPAWPAVPILAASVAVSSLGSTFRLVVADGDACRQICLAAKRERFAADEVLRLPHEQGAVCLHVPKSMMVANVSGVCLLVRV